MTDALETVGALCLRQATDVGAWLRLLSALPSGHPGLRLSGIAGLPELIGEGSRIQAIVSQYGAGPMRPVRVVYFDKGPDNNWSLGWHQDRTIAVRQKVELPGYSVWTVKQGIPHVEPPMAIIENMMTARVHVDPVDSDNAPLRIVPGSHRLGRINDSMCSQLAIDHGEMECHADAGDIWLYRTAIVHASHKAAVVNRRRVVQIDYSAEQLPAPLEWFGI